MALLVGKFLLAFLDGGQPRVAARSIRLARAAGGGACTYGSAAQTYYSYAFIRAVTCQRSRETDSNFRPAPPNLGPEVGVIR